jgi:hypothetical protein
MTHDTPSVKRAYNLGLKAVPNFLTLSVEQIAYYEQHLGEIPQALARGFIIPPDPRFALVKTLDITVPTDYVHATQLATFTKENKRKCYYWNDAITDPNFAKVTTVLTPGRKFKVKVFKQVVSGTTTSEERMAFLRSHKTVFVGAQGASLVFEQQRQALPKGYWYASFDEKDALWQDSGGCRRVPGVLADSVGDFDFGLGRFEEDWHDGNCLLCFCDDK